MQDILNVLHESAVRRQQSYEQAAARYVELVRGDAPVDAHEIERVCRTNGVSEMDMANDVRGYRSIAHEESKVVPDFVLSDLAEAATAATTQYISNLRAALREWVDTLDVDRLPEVYRWAIGDQKKLAEAQGWARSMAAAQGAFDAKRHERESQLRRIAEQKARFPRVFPELAQADAQHQAMSAQRQADANYENLRRGKEQLQQAAGLKRFA